MARALFLLILVIIEGCRSASVMHSAASGYNETDSYHNKQLLSRKKRFLLFPVNANLLVTVSGAKAMIYKGPGGNFLIAELDLYHPLPDYRYRISSLRLGEIAMLPPEPPKPNAAPVPPPPPSPPPSTMEPHDHHNGQELSPMELDQYLKDHPDAYVPPGYGKDRSDWLRPGTYNPYVDYRKQSYAYQPSYVPLSNRMYQPYQSKLWQTDPSNYFQQNFPRKKRSTDGEFDYELDEEEDRFNISHHRDWEHFYHYRERREIYHTLENEIGDKFDFPMKACVLRAICEARSFLLPPGKSMIMDIVRIVFSVPLKQELQDEYSAAMREKNVDCHELYGKKCPISILYLILFGKFVP